MKRSVKRRIGYVAAYEVTAALAVAALFAIEGQDIVKALPMSLTVSAISAGWNYVWNTIFEAMERRFKWKGRSVGHRILQAGCFEGGLALLVIPLMAWWFSIGLIDALLMEISVLVFLLFFAYAFNWAFDKVFGLPESAR